MVGEGSFVRLADYRPQITSSQEKQIDEYLKQLDFNPYSPPTSADLGKDLLVLLEDDSKIVGCIKENGNITVAEVRDMFNTSCKYAMAIMEHLDQGKMTRSVGDERVLR